VFQLFDLILMLGKTIVSSRKNTDPTQTALVWFGSDFIFKVNRIKPNHMLFYLAVQMTFILKIKPNRTTNTLIGSI